MRSPVKKWLRLALRLCGVALVVFVISRIDFSDSLTWPDGRQQHGEIVALADDSVHFRAGDEPAPTAIRLDAPGAPRVERGVYSIVRDAHQGLLLVTLLLFGPITLISIIRWWLLLRAIKCPISFGEALRLSYIGFFFTAVMPGLTGGDLVKAFYVARGSREPYRMFLSVFIDRFIGLFGLALLGAAVVTLHADEPAFFSIAVLVYTTLAVGTLVGCVMLSRRLRRLLRVEQILARLPFARVWQRIDNAVTIYRDAPGTVFIAVLLSLINHGGIILQTVIIGRALGIPNPATHYFAITPLCFLVASIPLLPGGWGMREGAFAYFFAMVGVPPESSVPTSLLLGLAQLAWYLLGGPVFIARPDRATQGDLEQFGASMEQGGEGGGPPSAENAPGDGRGLSRESR
jgi:hypothetical protein